MSGRRRQPAAGVVDRLAHFFHRNGYVRLQNQDRLSAEGHMRYKKGDELRLVAEDLKELGAMLRLLMRAGFEPGQPFVKGRRIRVPVYGRDQVLRFLELIQGAGRKGRAPRSAKGRSRTRSR